MAANLSTSTSIAAHIGIKNEVELIGPLLDYLPTIGIKHILVSDISSTDGSREEILKRESDHIWLQNLPDNCISDRCPPDDGWDRKVYEFVSKAACEWLLFLDADEFPLCLGGDLRTVEALSTHDVISLERFNVAVSESGPCLPPELPLNLGKILAIVDPIHDMREHLRRNPWTPWIMAKVMPKVMVRAHLLKDLTPGCHDVVTCGPHARRTVANDVVIAHLPISTLQRAKRKASSITEAFKLDGADFHGKDSWLNNELAWHWRRLAMLDSMGKTNDEFRRNVFDDFVMKQLISAGRVCSAYELLQKRSRADHGSE